LEDIGVDRLMDNVKMDPREIEWGSWTGLFYLRIGTGGGGGLFEAVMKFRIHKILGNSLLAEEL